MEDDVWSATQSDWDSFLENLRSARAAVGTTYAGSWFRGQVHDWDLSPSIFRELPELELQITRLLDKLKICDNNLLKAHSYLKRRGGNLTDDVVTHRLAGEAALLRRQLERLKHHKPTDGNVRGEGRAFVEFRFRSGSHHQSSWQTLAEMQHYGVPTRLLDWTESFVHALAFALQGYASALAELWANDRHSEKPPQRLRWHNVRVTRTLRNGELVQEIPTVWVLNPYKLAEASKGKNVLWDPTLNPSDDYFRLFVDGNPDLDHRFTVPIPILSPWRDERIAAQRGVFTCHGRDIRALNHQLAARVVRPVRLSQNAAIHGVRFLAEVGALDKFAMFRDKDSLGRKTREEFLSMPLSMLYQPP